jgi:fermentation-respiration switch protein FrsA (DUF1100 family)
MKIILKLLFAVVIVFLLAIGGIYTFQEKFIFIPKDLDEDYTYSFPSLASNVTFEELFIDTEDGARLNALYFKVDKPNGLVVYFHGNANNLSKWGAISSQFTQHNYNVIMLDYRGYGKSTGKRTEKNMYEDALVFYKKATELFPEYRTTVYGRSLGATFATYVASKNKPRKLILESPFYSLTDVVKTRYPFLPAEKLLKYSFNSGMYASEVKSNVTVIHGMDDGIVPFSSGEKLFKVFPEDLRKMVAIVGGKHNNLSTYQEFALALHSELAF